MTGVSTLLFTVFSGFGVLAQELPSGQRVELFEVLIDEVGAETWTRFRFLAPAIARVGGTVQFDDVEGDFEYLCQTTALPYLADYAITSQVVVVALLDRPVAFGTADAEATQFIEAFRVTSGACEWEAF